MDSIPGQIDKTYLENLMHYQRVLLQRNAWLKNQALRPADNNTELEYYNSQLAGDADYIYRQRMHFLEGFLPLLNDFYQRLSGGKEQISVTYSSDLTQKPLGLWLEQNLQSDLRYQRTPQGHS